MSVTERDAVVLEPGDGSGYRLGAADARHLEVQVPGRRQLEDSYAGAALGREAHVGLHRGAIGGERPTRIPHLSPAP